MKALPPVLTRHNPTRERIFAALLTEPTRHWSVAELATDVPEVSADAARTTLYLLLAHGLVRQSPGHRRLTFHLTMEGAGSPVQSPSSMAGRAFESGRLRPTIHDQAGAQTVDKHGVARQRLGR